MKQKLVLMFAISTSILIFFSNVGYADVKKAYARDEFVDPCANLEGGTWEGHLNGDEVKAAFSKIDNYLMVVRFKTGQSLVWELTCTRKNNDEGEIIVESPHLIGAIKHNAIMLADETGNFASLKKT